MSRVDSPFHAIAAEALDGAPDVPEVAAANVSATVAPSSLATVPERDSVTPAVKSNPDTSGDEEAAGKNGSSEQEQEQTPGRHEPKVSFEGGAEANETVTKKSKKRTNVWTKTTSRKSAKKVKNSGVRQSDTKDDNVLLKPFHQEDDPSYPILLSKLYKAEKIELSTDRLTASGSKGYRTVRATRGVFEGAWFFEISVDRLGDTGHTRLGWITRRGDLQAPVGYDTHSYSYRDLNGCKVHAAQREEYGDAYHEKDVIGFYINLPREPGFTRKPEEEVVGYKGQPYIIIAEEPLMSLPGSEILFFKNGVCQGVAFKDVYDGSYFPAASMYTLPSQDCCKVVFNFGPDFRYPVTDIGDRPRPSPMCQASGPGEARTGAVPTTQTEAVLDSTVNGGGKWLTPEHGNAIEVEEAADLTKEEIPPKEVEKVASVAKKKVKRPKVPAGNHIPVPLPKTSKAGGFQFYPEFKRDVNLKASKNDMGLLGVGSTALLSQKGAKNDTGLPNPEGIRKDKVRIPKRKAFPNLEGMQKGERLSNLKGGQKDKGPSLKGSKKILSVTDIPSLKGTKQDMPAPGSIAKVAGLQGFRGNKKDVPVMAQNFQESKTDWTVAGLQSMKGTQRDISGSGLPQPKKIKKDLAGMKSALKMSKDLTGPGTAHKASTKDLLGTGSVPPASRHGLPGIGQTMKTNKTSLTGREPALKSGKKLLAGTGSTHKLAKKDFGGSGYLPRGLGPSAYSGGRSWGDGMRGAMDVDVVVVESSAPSQAEGSFGGSVS